MTPELQAINSELATALAQLDGDSPSQGDLRLARDATWRAQAMLDALLAKGEQWTVEEILAREG